MRRVHTLFSKKILGSTYITPYVCPKRNLSYVSQITATNPDVVQTRRVSQLDPRQVTANIRSFTRSNNIDKVLETLDSALSDSRADQYVIEAALQSCFSLNQAERVPEVLAKLTNFGVELSEVMLSALIVGYCKVNPEQAFESFEVAQEMGMSISHKENILIESLIEHNMVPQAHIVLKTMKATSAKYKYPNEATWSSVAKAASLGNNHGLALELFTQYDGDFTKLTNGFWKYVLGGYFNRGDIKSAVAAWDLCKAHSTPAAIPYSVVIPMFSKVQQFDEVLKLYEEMLANGQMGDDTVYMTVLRVYARTNRVDMAHQVLDTMRKQGLKPSQQAYYEVLDSWVKANDFPKVLSLLGEMKADGVKPTNIMWTRLIHGLGKAVQLDRALGVISKLSSNDQLDVVTYRNVLSSLLLARLGEYSTLQLEELRQLGINYDDSLQNAVLHTVNDALDGIQGNFNTILDELDAAGLQPDEPMFNILLDACVRKRQMDYARAIIQRMQTQYKITPSHITWTIFMKGLGMAGLVDEAVALFQEKIPPTTRSQYDYNTMIYQMIKNNRLDLAMKYFEEMNTSGVEPIDITASIHY